MVTKTVWVEGRKSEMVKIIKLYHDDDLGYIARGSDGVDYTATEGMKIGEYYVLY